MRDFGAVEDRVRTPVRGLRQRLRIALRAAGFKSKFRTDHLRHSPEAHIQGDALVVMVEKYEQLPFHEFEGRLVWLHTKRQP